MISSSTKVKIQPEFAGELIRFLGNFEITHSYSTGEVSEWFKEHAWKACVGVTPP
jgi:hypothetical protein